MKYFPLLSLIFFSMILWGKKLPDEYYSGGETTVFIENNKAFSRPLANISPKTLRHHSIGNSFFNQNWIEAPASTTGRDGLGPIFNARSCSACHPNDGKGRPLMNGVNKLGMVTRISIPGRADDGGPLGDPRYGTQLSDFALPTLEPEARIRIKYTRTLANFANQESFFLRKPELVVTNLSMGPLSDEIRFSNRLAPPVHGMGLIDALADETILSFADPDDRDGDGISGRPNTVWDREKGKKGLGRFGWKASQATLKQQIADAFLNDIGITSGLHPREALSPYQHETLALGTHKDGATPEASDKIIDRVTTYLATIAPPARRQIEEDGVQRGQKIFQQIKCASCHIPEMVTRPDASLPELANQTIRPYSDFLLHDMGPRLADGRQDFEASGREWRTPPLWGIGLQHVVSRHSFFLHDGRAQNVIEAILWHGGEGQDSCDQFVALPRDDREALFKFLNSL
ncbi:MAG: CxxC motif-containing protein (DUF1111 family) [Akkermansiaceae bacterium]|jgi:CxxC motif-containing protein (DUF1111 family)